MAGLESDEIRHALAVAREHGFAEVEISAGDVSFKASLEPVKRKKPVASEVGEPELGKIKATLVGYYAEGRVPLASGGAVKKGDVVGVITALGLANDLESSVSGEVVEVLVQPGDAVQYGQTIATVRS